MSCQQCSLGCSRAVEHLLDHLFERIYDLSAGQVLSPALYLVALKAVGVVHGNRDPAAVLFYVVQRGFEEHITDSQLSVLSHELECKRDYVGSPSAQVARSHILFSRSFFTFSLSILFTSILLAFGDFIIAPMLMFSKILVGSLVSIKFNSSLKKP